MNINRVCIVGASGKLGQYMVQHARDRGYDVVGAIEAPRGTLYHSYTINEEGAIVKSDCVIPTGQNHANIHHDLQALVPVLAAEGRGEEEISKRAQMLVRAYDPCISCSVH